jgi:transcriptional regulatory protein RtcR
MHWRDHNAARVCAIKVCRESDSMADAAKKLFAVSFKTKKSSNNSKRLSKYLAKFGLKFKGLRLRK